MLQKEPDDVFLNFGMAMELIKEGKTEEALARFDRVLVLDPTYTAAHHHKAITLIGLHRLEEAREALHAGLQAARMVHNAHAECEMQELLESIT